MVIILWQVRCADFMGFDSFSELKNCLASMGTAPVLKAAIPITGGLVAGMA
jgi:hypothetical protein